MSQAAKVIVGETWAELTTAGQSGSCWIKEGVDSNLKGNGNIQIVHATSLPTGDAGLAYSKRVYKPAGNADVLQLTADNSSDIFYARGLTSDDGATVIVDAV